MTSPISSLSNSAFLTPALFALQNASGNVANSVARLSSGNRIVNVGDDVAAFSIASGLQSQLTGLRQASSNVAQANSLLQIASGGLQQISTLLDNLNTIAVQSNSSSVTNTQRGYLQQQFASYLAAIDTIAGSTTFNGIKLLDGSLAGSNKLLTQTSSATKGSAHITLTANPSAGQTVVLNGVTFTADTEFAVGGTASITASNLATALNNSTNTAISGATYEANGAAITITAKNGGTLSNQYVINKAASTATFVTDGATTNVANKVTLFGGLDNGLGVNSTKVAGSVGNSLATTQTQTAANVTLSVSGTISAAETVLLGDGAGGSVTFTFRAAPATSTEVLIGATTEESLQNLAKTITAYSNTNASGDNFGLRQLEFSVNNSSLVIKNRNVGNVNDLSGAAIAISETLANGSVSGASFNNGTNGGVNTSGVTNSAFVGTLSGFTATYVGADSLTASVTVGGKTYTSAITDTTPAGNTTARFSSTDGGYFDVQLAAGQGTTVANQSDANTYAARLSAVFNGLTFYQERGITNYTPANDLLGSTASIQLSDSNTVKISNVKVTAPDSPSSDGTIDFTINGSTFRASSGLGGQIGAYETVRFTNLSDSNQVLTFRNGSTAQDFSTANAAATLQSALSSAFQVDVAGTGSNFQVGPSTADVLNVSIDSASTYTLFNGVTPSVGTQGNAATAQTLIATALETVQTMQSKLGGNISSLNIADAGLQSTITGVQSAHSQLYDTDVVFESTQFAQETLKVNAGVAIIAQALSLRSGLLNLVSISGKG